MPNRIHLLILTAAIALASVTSAQEKPLASAVRSKETPGATTRSSVAAHIHGVEDGYLLPTGDGTAPLRFDIHQLMKILNVPGVSIAVIDNYKIVWAKGYGVTEIGGSTPITAKTLFQAGSISKAVTAAGALSLVEHGKLSLDEDVNKKLVSWKVPANEFTKDQKVTLRRLMSHSAGLSVHGFPGYEAGEPVPTLVQVFNGEKPANSDPIVVTFVPGTRYLYSGGGITIEQQLIIDASGKPFPQFMHEAVLSKIGMKDSTFEQPLPSRLASSASSGNYSLDGKVVPGKWHTYPEMAAAGLWTTPTDLAKYAIEIALSKHGKANHVLSEAMTREMLKPQIPQVPAAHMGLGFHLGDERAPDMFMHDGVDKGFNSLLIMFGDSGQGAAIMTNSYENGTKVAGMLFQSLAREYGWKYTPYHQPVSDVLPLVEATKGVQAALDEYQYLKAAALPQFVLNDSTLTQFGHDLLVSNKPDEAIQVLKFSVQQNPKNAKAYDGLGDCYARTGQKKLAIQNYQKSLELNPKNQNASDMLKKLSE